MNNVDATQSQKDLTWRLQKLNEASVAAAVAPVLEPAREIPSADMAADLAAILARVTLDERVREAQTAALVIKKFKPHLDGLARRLEREHQAGPMAERLIAGVIDAVGICGAQIERLAVKWQRENE